MSGSQIAREIVDEECKHDVPTEANVAPVLAGQLRQLPAWLRKLDLRLVALQPSDDRPQSGYNRCGWADRPNHAGRVSG